jgi:hypothetical protein
MIYLLYFIFKTKLYLAPTITHGEPLLTHIKWTMVWSILVHMNVVYYGKSKQTYVPGCNFLSMLVVFPNKTKIWNGSFGIYYPLQCSLLCKIH